MVDYLKLPQTPPISNINVAEAYDWQHRANSAEHELAVKESKLEREKRKGRRLQGQIKEYIEALARTTQSYSEMRNQCQFLANSNLVLSHEVEKLRLVVQTLEGVIHLLYSVETGIKNGGDNNQ